MLRAAALVCAFMLGGLTSFASIRAQGVLVNGVRCTPLGQAGVAQAQFDPCIVVTHVVRSMHVNADASANLTAPDGDVCTHNSGDTFQNFDRDPLTIDAAIDADAACSDAHGFSNAFAFARQIGAAQPLVLTGSVIAHGVAEVDFFATQLATGRAGSFFDIGFQVLLERRFTFEASAHAEVAGAVAPSSANARFDLTGPGIALSRRVDASAQDQSPAVAASVEGTLVPGMDYVIRVRCNVVGSNVPGAQGIANGIASFTLRLEPRPGGQDPRCPQDWNNDGLVDSRDFFAFLTDFFAETADFNSDCRSDSQDFFDFVAHFFIICG